MRAEGAGSPRGRAGDAVDGRLARAADIGDLRELARRRAPQVVFDYTDRSAGVEVGLWRSREGLRLVEFRPGSLRHFSVVDPSTVLPGRPSTLPPASAPTGSTRLTHRGRDGGGPGGRAGRHPARPVDHGHRDDRGARGRMAGPGPDRQHARGRVQVRDVRSGFTIPPASTAGTVANAAVHPRGSIDRSRRSLSGSPHCAPGAARWPSSPTASSNRPRRRSAPAGPRVDHGAGRGRRR